MRRLSLLIATISSLVLAVPVSTANASSAGSYDDAFGSSGVAYVNFGSRSETSGMKVLPDGRILLAGSGRNGTDNDFALTRLTANGAVDPTFGVGGYTTTAIGAAGDRTADLAVQSDGKIVVVGETENGSDTELAIVRYNSNGTLDTSFDGDSGSGNGIVTLDIANEDDHATRVLIQPDGKILLGAYSYIGYLTDFVVVRYNSNGTLDTSFDGDSGSGNGIVITGIGTADYLTGLALTNDGKIVAAGTSYINSKFAFSIVRYNSNGTLDTSFDTDGKTFVSPATYENYAKAMVLQPDGKIVVVGTCDFGNGSVQFAYALTRHNPDGSIDSSFGTNGIVATDYSHRTSTPLDTNLQPDGKIVVVGGGYVSSQTAINVTRYLSNGSLDTTFAIGGVSNTMVMNASQIATAIGFQSNGQILVAGSADDYTTTKTFVIRYHHQTPPTTTSTLAPAQPVDNTADTPLIANYKASNKKVVITWNSRSIDSKYLVTTTKHRRICQTTSNLCSVTGLSNGKQYTFYLYPINKSGIRSSTPLKVLATPGFQVKKTTVKTNSVVPLSSLVASPSKGSKKWRVSRGKCQLVSNRLITPAKTGSCLLTLSIAAKGSYASMATTVRVTVVR